MVPAVAMVTLIASVAPLVAGRLAARLAIARARLTIARAALVSVEIAATAAATTATMIGAFLVGRAFAPVLRLGLGLGCFGGRAAKQLLHPAEHATRILRFLRSGGGRGLRTARSLVGAFGPALWAGAGTLLGRLPRAILAALPFRAIIGTIAPAVFAVGARASGPAAFRAPGVGAGLPGDVAERFTLPTLFHPPRCFRRKNLELWFGSILRDGCRRRRIRHRPICGRRISRHSWNVVG